MLAMVVDLSFGPFVFDLPQYLHTCSTYRTPSFWCPLSLWHRLPGIGQQMPSAVSYRLPFLSGHPGAILEQVCLLSSLCKVTPWIHSVHQCLLCQLLPAFSGVPTFHITGLDMCYFSNNPLILYTILSLVVSLLSHVFSNSCWCFMQAACLEICKRGTAQAMPVVFLAGYGTWTHLVKLLCLKRFIKATQKELYKSLKGTLHCIPTRRLFLSI